jgi:hypothetical protein
MSLARFARRCGYEQRTLDACVSQPEGRGHRDQEQRD